MEDTKYPQAQRVSDLWFDDGNVVIKAGCRLFKLYRGVLAAQASFFADFGRLPPIPHHTTMGSCSVMELPDDPVSMEYFLRAIMQPSFFLPPPSPSQYHIVAAVLRLAHKYDAATFRDRALRHLSARYPCSLKDFVNRHKYSRPLFGSYNRENGEADAYETDAAALLCEVGAIWCIPIHHELMSVQKTVAFIMNGINFGSRHYEFSQEQKTSMLGGKQNFAQDLAARISRISVPASNCQDIPQCGKTYHALLRVFLTELQGRLNLWFWNLDFQNILSLCQPCKTKMDESFVQLMDEMWVSIPGHFGLPPWPTLCEMKRKALGYVDEYDG